MIDQAQCTIPAARAGHLHLSAPCDADSAALQAPRAPAPPTPRPVPRSADVNTLHLALATGMDRLSHGVALFDVDGRAHYANAAARALLGRLGWSRDDAGLLSTPAGWASVLRRVCQGGRREIQRMEVKEVSMVVVLAPLSVPGQEFAFAVFGREELCGSVELQMFALHYQLTHAETLVLRHLTRGLNAAAIALEHGVACNTILTQIAAIRAKTRCNSVRSLLDMLARMPPLRPLQPVAETH